MFVSENRASAWRVAVVALCTACSSIDLDGLRGRDGGADGANVALGINVTPTSLSAAQGRSFVVQVNRVGSYRGLVDVKFSALPVGMTATPLQLAADITSGPITLSVATSMPYGPVSLDLLALGVGTEISAKASLGVTVVGAPGSPDTSFGNGGLLEVPGAANALAMEPDGAMTVAGSLSQGPTSSDFWYSRLLAAGLVDTSFGTAGVRTIDLGQYEGAAYLARTTSGRLLTFGLSTSSNTQRAALLRHSPDGTLDPTFGSGGVSLTLMARGLAPRSISVGSDDRIAVVGAWSEANTGSSDAILMRFTANGALDTTLAGTGQIVTDLGTVFDSSDAVLVQVDRSILTLLHGGGSWIAKWTEAGAIDAAYGVNGRVAVGGAVAIALETSGRLLVLQTDCSVRRLDATGKLDPSFGSGGTAKVDFPSTRTCDAIATQGDDRIVIAGRAAKGAGNVYALARFLPGGVLDPDFGVGGKAFIDALGSQYTLALSAKTARIVVLARNTKTQLLRVWQ